VIRVGSDVVGVWSDHVGWMMASMFDQIWSRLALAHLAQFVVGWHVIPVGSDVVRVWSDHVGRMMSSAPIQALMACLIWSRLEVGTVGTVCV
jgi:hypothetical protein